MPDTTTPTSRVAVCAPRCSARSTSSGRSRTRATSTGRSRSSSRSTAGESSGRGRGSDGASGAWSTSGCSPRSTGRTSSGSMFAALSGTAARPPEIQEVLLQAAIYCGVPAAMEAFRVAETAIKAAEAEARRAASGCRRRHGKRGRVSGGSTVGFVGLGAIGAPLARALLDAGHGSSPTTSTRRRPSRSARRRSTSRRRRGTLPIVSRSSS